MGNDPYDAMVMAKGTLLHMPYANFQVMLNIVLLMIEIFAGRKYIGAGTIVNALCLGDQGQTVIGCHSQISSLIQR